MASLESTLEKVTRGNKQAEKKRRYIVIEAIYQVSSIIRFLISLSNSKDEIERIFLFNWSVIYLQRLQ